MLSAVSRFISAKSLMLLLSSASLAACSFASINPLATGGGNKGSSGLNLTSGPNGYPYCTNGSNTGGGYGWDPSVTDPKGSHSCLVPPGDPGSIASNGYPYCTNGSNTGSGYGWDTSVTAPNGTHSCVVPPSTASAATPAPASPAPSPAPAPAPAPTSSTASSSAPDGVGPNGYPYCTNGSNTGGGYGWDTSVTDPHGSHSCLVPTSTASSSSSGGSTPSSGTLPALNVDAPANSSFDISNYGSTLQTNKDGLVAAANQAGASPEELALVIAMAMQETQLMEPSERDASKDGTASANCSILNLNYDMLTKLGYTLNDYGASLNNPANLSQAVGYLLKAFRTWGYESTLNYQRGGATAFADGVSYGAVGYRSAIATIYGQIAADTTLETDGRRVEIAVPHV